VKVRPSKACKTRQWWSAVRHLENQRMQVIGKDGEYIIFMAESGRIRRWHKSNLEVIGLSLENK